jgi:hypothetical protein
VLGRGLKQWVNNDITDEPLGRSLLEGCEPLRLISIASPFGFSGSLDDPGREYTDDPN